MPALVDPVSGSPSMSSASKRASARRRAFRSDAGEVEDLIGMAIYLLSPASDFCAGRVM
jgi:hypothetical protein